MTHLSQQTNPSYESDMYTNQTRFTLIRAAENRQMRKNPKRIIQIQHSEEEAAILETNMLAAGYTNKSKFLRDLWTGKIHLHIIAESYHATTQALWLQTNSPHIRAILDQWHQPEETNPKIDPAASVDLPNLLKPIPISEP